jgi:hypothetical protein
MTPVYNVCPNLRKPGLAKTRFELISGQVFLSKTRFSAGLRINQVLV